jgi:cytochrome c biogenesis protein CcmG, thiol:disulfide interchange protein DsbE
MILLSKNNWNILMLAVLLGGLGLIWASRAGSLPAASAPTPPVLADQAPAPEVGRMAPDFTLVTADGTQVTLSELRGQVVLINVWATWCPPCRAEMPAIQAAYERYAPEGFTVLAVNVGEDPATVSAYMRDVGLSFAAPLDRDGAVSLNYRVTAMPSSFFVDRRGVIRSIYRGPMSHGVISGSLEQLLVEP